MYWFSGRGDIQMLKLILDFLCLMFSFQETNLFQYDIFIIFDSFAI